MEKLKKFEITSMVLHFLAMALMLCDHLWATVVPGNEWLTCIGRLAFPIFAFMIVEGYTHTRDLKKYILRLFVFALISEIPFNLMVGSNVFYYPHQNVLWTFLCGILLIHLNEKAKQSGKVVLRILALTGSLAVGFAVGVFGLVDYLHAGIFTVLVFYFFKERKWWNFILQAVILYYLNTELIGGYGYELQLFGKDFFLVQQSFAVLALIPIWLYKGKQGPHNKFLKYFYYWFYPVHMLILALIKMYVI